MQTLKAVRAFQNNGPDYWVIYEGKKTFGADPIAHCDNEANAALIVKAVNTHERAKAALELARELLNDSNVRHYVSTKLGEQAKLHRFLNDSQKTLADMEG